MMSDNLQVLLRAAEAPRDRLAHEQQQQTRSQSPTTTHDVHSGPTTAAATMDDSYQQQQSSPDEYLQPHSFLPNILRNWLWTRRHRSKRERMLQTGSLHQQQPGTPNASQPQQIHSSDTSSIHTPPPQPLSASNIRALRRKTMTAIGMYTPPMITTSNAAKANDQINSSGPSSSKLFTGSPTLSPAIATAPHGGASSSASSSTNASSALLTRPSPLRLGHRSLRSLQSGSSVSNPHSFLLEGALLFVDMSGFTPLSERLGEAGMVGVEALSRHLNDYFGPIVQLIESFGGDVIKFAGDAIMVLFTNNRFADPGTSNDEILTLPQLICRAASCADSVHREFHEFRPAPDIVLKLHSAISAGPMYACVVGGAYDRYEFLLQGVPIFELAPALNEAKVGEIMLTRSAYERVTLLIEAEEVLIVETPVTTAPPSDTSSPPSESLPVPTPAARPKMLRRTTSEAAPRPQNISVLLQKPNNPLSSSNASSGLSRSPDFPSHLSSAKQKQQLQSNQPPLAVYRFKSLLITMPSPHAVEAAVPDSGGRNHQQDLSGSGMMLPASASSVAAAQSQGNASVSGAGSANVSANFRRYSGSNSNSRSASRSVSVSRNSNADAFPSPSPRSGTIIPSSGQGLSSSSSASAADAFLIPSVLARVQDGQGEYLAEFRRITTLFISLPTLPTHSLDPQVHQAALQELSHIVCIISHLIFASRGEIRQLITDDKGTVMICVFGLISHTHNALHGMRAGCEIVSRLLLKKHQVHIGITTGMIFCGCIGTMHRCEYTFIGDKINTSARLMVAAMKKGVSVLCDDETLKTLALSPQAVVPVLGMQEKLATNVNTQMIVNAVATTVVASSTAAPSTSASTTSPSSPLAYLKHGLHILSHPPLQLKGKSRPFSVWCISSIKAAVVKGVLAGEYLLAGGETTTSGKRKKVAQRRSGLLHEIQTRHMLVQPIPTNQAYSTQSTKGVSGAVISSPSSAPTIVKPVVPPSANTVPKLIGRTSELALFHLRLVQACLANGSEYRARLRKEQRAANRQQQQVYAVKLAKRTASSIVNVSHVDALPDASASPMLQATLTPPLASAARPHHLDRRRSAQSNGSGGSKEKSAATLLSSMERSPQHGLIFLESVAGFGKSAILSSLVDSCSNGTLTSTQYPYLDLRLEVLLSTADEFSSNVPYYTIRMLVRCILASLYKLAEKNRRVKKKEERRRRRAKRRVEEDERDGVVDGEGGEGISGDASVRGPHDITTLTSSTSVIHPTDGGGLMQRNNSLEIQLEAKIAKTPRSGRDRTDRDRMAVPRTQPRNSESSEYSGTSSSDDEGDDDLGDAYDTIQLDTYSFRDVSLLDLPPSLSCLQHLYLLNDIVPGLKLPYLPPRKKWIQKFHRLGSMTKTVEEGEEEEEEDGESSSSDEDTSTEEEVEVEMGEDDDTIDANGGDDAANNAITVPSSPNVDPAPRPSRLSISSRPRFASRADSDADTDILSEGGGVASPARSGHESGNESSDEAESGESEESEDGFSEESSESSGSSDSPSHPHSNRGLLRARLRSMHPHLSSSSASSMAVLDAVTSTAASSAAQTEMQAARLARQASRAMRRLQQSNTDAITSSASTTATTTISLTAHKQKSRASSSTRSFLRRGEIEPTSFSVFVSPPATASSASTTTNKRSTPNSGGTPTLLNLPTPPPRAVSASSALRSSPPSVAQSPHTPLKSDAVPVLPPAMSAAAKNEAIESTILELLTTLLDKLHASDFLSLLTPTPRRSNIAIFVDNSQWIDASSLTLLQTIHRVLPSILCIYAGRNISRNMMLMGKEDREMKERDQEMKQKEEELAKKGAAGGGVNPTSPTSSVMRSSSTSSASSDSQRTALIGSQLIKSAQQRGSIYILRSDDIQKEVDEKIERLKTQRQERKKSVREEEDEDDENDDSDDDKKRDDDTTANGANQSTSTDSTASLFTPSLLYDLDYYDKIPSLRPPAVKITSPTAANESAKVRRTVTRGGANLDGQGGVINRRSQQRILPMESIDDDPMRDFENSLLLRVSGLSRTDLHALICHHHSVTHIANELFQFIYDKSNGSPYYVEQLFVSLSSRQMLSITHTNTFLDDEELEQTSTLDWSAEIKKKGGLSYITAAHDDTKLLMTDNIEDLIGQRLDTLSPSQQLILKVCSVFGMEVYAEAVLRVILLHDIRHDMSGAANNNNAGTNSPHVASSHKLERTASLTDDLTSAGTTTVAVSGGFGTLVNPHARTPRSSPVVNSNNTNNANSAASPRLLPIPGSPSQDGRRLGLGGNNNNASATPSTASVAAALADASTLKSSSSDSPHHHPHMDVPPVNTPSPSPLPLPAFEIPTFLQHRVKDFDVLLVRELLKLDRTLEANTSSESASSGTESEKESYRDNAGGGKSQKGMSTISEHDDAHHNHHTHDATTDYAHYITRLKSLFPGIHRRIYTFTHVLTRDVIYSRLPFSYRAILHYSAAEWYLERFSENLVPYLPKLSWHYLSSAKCEVNPSTKVKTYKQALTYLLLAGHNATSKYAAKEALEYFNDARSILPEVYPASIHTPNIVPQARKWHEVEILEYMLPCYTLVNSVPQSLKEYEYMLHLVEELHEIPSMNEWEERKARKYRKKREERESARVKRREAKMAAAAERQQQGEQQPSTTDETDLTASSSDSDSDCECDPIPPPEVLVPESATHSLLFISLLGVMTALSNGPAALGKVSNIESKLLRLGILAERLDNTIYTTDLLLQSILFHSFSGSYIRAGLDGLQLIERIDQAFVVERAKAKAALKAEKEAKAEKKAQRMQQMMMEQQQQQQAAATSSATPSTPILPESGPIMTIRVISSSSSAITAPAAPPLISSTSLTSTTVSVLEPDSPVMHVDEVSAMISPPPLSSQGRFFRQVSEASYQAQIRVEETFSSQHQMPSAVSNVVGMSLGDGVGTSAQSHQQQNPPQPVVMSHVDALHKSIMAMRPRSVYSPSLGGRLITAWSLCNLGFIRLSLDLIAQLQLIAQRLPGTQAAQQAAGSRRALVGFLQEPMMTAIEAGKMVQSARAAGNIFSGFVWQLALNQIRARDGDTRLRREVLEETWKLLDDGKRISTMFSWCPCLIFSFGSDRASWALQLKYTSNWWKHSFSGREEANALGECLRYRAHAWKMVWRERHTAKKGQLAYARHECTGDAEAKGEIPIINSERAFRVDLPVSSPCSPDRQLVSIDPTSLPCSILLTHMFSCLFRALVIARSQAARFVELRTFLTILDTLDEIEHGICVELKGEEKKREELWEMDRNVRCGCAMGKKLIQIMKDLGVRDRLRQQMATPTTTTTSTPSATPSSSSSSATLSTHHHARTPSAVAISFGLNETHGVMVQCDEQIAHRMLLPSHVRVDEYGLYQMLVAPPTSTSADSSVATRSFPLTRNHHSSCFFTFLTSLRARSYISIRSLFLTVVRPAHVERTIEELKKMEAEREMEKQQRREEKKRRQEMKEGQQQEHTESSSAASSSSSSLDTSVTCALPSASHLVPPALLPIPRLGVSDRLGSIETFQVAIARMEDGRARAQWNVKQHQLRESKLQAQQRTRRPSAEANTTSVTTTTPTPDSISEHAPLPSYQPPFTRHARVYPL